MRRIGIVVGSVIGLFQTRSLVDALRYETHYSATVSGDSVLAAALVPQAAEWTAKVTVVGSRGRFEILSARQGATLAPGDYRLFELGSWITVHPARAVAELGVLPSAESPPARFGIETSVDSLESSVDSSLAPDTIGGRPMRRVRTRLSYALVTVVPQPVDVGVMRSVTHMTLTTTYWFADSVVLRSPLPEGAAASWATGPIADEMRRLNQVLPQLAIVKQVSVSQVRNSAGAAQIERTTEQSHWERTKVDPLTLAVPSAIRIVQSNGSAPRDSAQVRRWQSPPP